MKTKRLLLPIMLVAFTLMFWGWALTHSLWLLCGWMIIIGILFLIYVD